MARSGERDDPSWMLREAGLRVTASRRAVLETLRGRAHASADEVFREVAVTVPRTSLQSVYNALGDFANAGLVRRIEPAGRAGLFELRVGDNHHHAVCSSCGAIADIECAVGEAPCLAPIDSRGFVIHTAEVTYWGTCPSCSSTSAPPA